MRLSKNKEGLPSEVLEAFFAMPPAGILEEIDSLSRAIEEVRFTEKKFRRTQNSQTSPREIALSAHRRLLLGVHMGDHSSLPSDLVLFSATLPAFEIAEMACTAACESGRLLELSDTVITWEEEHVFSGSKPMISAVEESDKILSGIHDTVLLEALSRYGFSEYIELYETNRPLYEIRSEVGRRLIDPDLVDKEENETITAGFRQQFGPDFVDEFTRRLDSHGLLTA